MTSKGTDQAARMHRLIGGFAGRTYHIVGNLMSWLIQFKVFMMFKENGICIKIYFFSEKIDTSLDLIEMFEAWEKHW